MRCNENHVQNSDGEFIDAEEEAPKTTVKWKRVITTAAPKDLGKDSIFCDAAFLEAKIQIHDRNDENGHSVSATETNRAVIVMVASDKKPRCRSRDEEIGGYKIYYDGARKESEQNKRFDAGHAYDAVVTVKTIAKKVGTYCRSNNRDINSPADSSLK